MRVVIANNTEAELHHGCWRVMSNIRRALAERGAEVIASHQAGTDWRSDGHFCAALAGADALLVNGEGTIHSDRPAGLALLALSDEARRAGCYSALVNFSWAGNSPENASALQDFNLVAARESHSCTELAELGIEVALMADMSLAYPDAPARVRQGIGWTDSVLSPVARRLHRLARDAGWRHVPIQMPPGGGMFRRRHLAFADFARPARMFRSLRLDLAIHRDAEKRPASYLNSIAGLEGLVTGRFHAVCLAILAGTPFLAIESNTHKISALVADAGLSPERVVEQAMVGHLAPDVEVPPWTKGERSAIDSYVDWAHAANARIFDRFVSRQ
ncbi:MAG: polysaccharide pyruvyl transferase family protein [Paracoccaceae bacterium]